MFVFAAPQGIARHWEGDQDVPWQAHKVAALLQFLEKALQQCDNWDSQFSDNTLDAGDQC